MLTIEPVLITEPFIGWIFKSTNNKINCKKCKKTWFFVDEGWGEHWDYLKSFNRKSKNIFWFLWHFSSYTLCQCIYTRNNWYPNSAHSFHELKRKLNLINRIFWHLVYIHINFTTRLLFVSILLFIFFCVCWRFCTSLQIVSPWLTRSYLTWCLNFVFSSTGVNI